MGTEVHYKSFFQGYYSMRDVNDDSNSSGWPLFYGDKALTNGHYYNGFIPKTVTDAYPGYDKDALKQKMLQHEAIFKNQVYELHRLYRRQRDMMEEVKRNEFQKHQISVETSSSSSLLPSQKPYEDVQRWHIPRFPLANSTCARPSKVRKKLFDLRLPADEYIDPEEGEQVQDNQASEFSSYPLEENCFLHTEGVKTSTNGSRKKDFRGFDGLADLNEPAQVEEAIAHDSVDFLGSFDKSEASPFLGQPQEARNGSQTRAFNRLPVECKVNGRDGVSYMHEAGRSRSSMNFASQCFQEHSRLNEIPLVFATSRTSSSHPFLTSSDNRNSWSPLAPSRGKPNDSLTCKFTSFERHPSFLSSQSREVLGEKWHTNVFDHGSSSGSKEPSACVPLIGFDHRNCNKGSNFIDSTGTMKGMDLNSVQTLSNEDDDPRNHDRSVVPWVSKNDSENGKRNTEMEHRGIDINVAWDDDTVSEPTIKQIDVETRDIDAEIKNHFDLNSCVTEDEDLLAAESVKSSEKVEKIRMEIDLEAPLLAETEGEELVKVAAEAIAALSGQQDHVGSVSPVVGFSDDDDCLRWFAEAIVSRVENMASASREIDEYELLTLQLEETKEEDYMPKPLAPDFLEPDKAGPVSLPNRPRRGQARRGRPRRDFQRDILPGLVSLSRQEITEDLRVFGGTGLTRRNGTRTGARGRRKAVEPPLAATPPPPLSQRLNCIEVVGLEEGRLTGWGRTTRRPRRPRCAAGNSVAVRLT